MASPMPFTSLLDSVGAAGAALTTLCWLPQVLKLIREKETSGLGIGDWPLIGSNAVTLALMGVIRAMKLRHG